VKAAKKTALKSKARKVGTTVKKGVEKPKVQELVTLVQAAVEPALTETTA
jgi:hypothetical protein